ncbi:MAG: hypothetical protein IPQ02_19505 [Saprospiraceae bacterium]|uniref:Uncharacterized protein n=1 Tax=Candidatus Defluviibacterium haderslevense TaxID=2981993 RepID=A0A9D7S7I4_9BACT|nr:hypothetical protein [Candidatus Defluviibacterium haderslevense]MBL0238717.1 hypothetical protein [Candidatus Defluviibacterium haderslevense]
MELNVSFYGLGNDIIKIPCSPENDCDPFYAAQKELREMGFDPYQWAGFILVE